MNVVFYNRNFNGKIPLNLEPELERYSWAMIGGPDSATLHVHPTADRWELTKLLRCPVEIYGGDGGLKWWGFVNRVIIPVGNIRVGLGLDNLYNSIQVQYDKGVTSAGLDAQSISEYGTKQFFIDLSNATRTDAEHYRNTYLAGHKYAMSEVELSGQSEDIIIECLGWWQTLAWKYYSNTSDTNTDNATQIYNIITSAGQFINGVILENTAGVSCTQKRDGRSNALNYVMELLNAGTINTRPLLAWVDKNRYVHVYERIAETTQYIMRDDGKLETVLGKLVPEEDCINAVWVTVKGVPSTLGGGVAAMRPFFIERAECVAEGING